jgi:hypothetical protein
VAGDPKPPMLVDPDLDPTPENELYLRLFITNGGGW